MTQLEQYWAGSNNTVTRSDIVKFGTFLSDSRRPGTVVKCQTATGVRVWPPWSRRAGVPVARVAVRRSTGHMWSESQRRVPVTRRAAAFWTDCSRFTVLQRCLRTASCSSPGISRQRPDSLPRNNFRENRAKGLKFSADNTLWVLLEYCVVNLLLLWVTCLGYKKISKSA